MYRIVMDLLCLEGYSEVLPEEVGNTELVIEDLVAMILLDLFGLVAVDGVQVTCSSSGLGQLSSCLLQVRATCETEVANALDASLELQALRLEGTLSCSLIQLFSEVQVNRLTVLQEYSPAPELVALSW